MTDGSQSNNTVDLKLNYTFFSVSCIKYIIGFTISTIPKVALDEREIITECKMKFKPKQLKMTRVEALVAVRANWSVF